MPVILVVLFIVALFITLAGLLLSPRAQPRRSQNEYLITPKGRRMVESTSMPARARRVVTTSAPLAAPMRRRASALTGEIHKDPTATSRTRATTRRVSAEFADSAHYAGRRSRSAGVAYPYPGPWEVVKDRLGSWQVAVPGLIAIFLLGFYLLNTVLPYPLLWMPVSFNSANPPSGSASGSSPVYTASQHLLRLSQLDPAQYQSSQEFNLWAYSACSAASMTEVINSYNHTYRITDILRMEAALHEITPQDGLLEEAGIQQTGLSFGFKTVWGHNLSLSQVIAAANSGTPVIVSFPPARYPGGHVLVVRGGNSSYVYLADSSRLNWTQISHDRFMQLWAGFYAIMTPAK